MRIAGLLLGVAMMVTLAAVARNAHAHVKAARTHTDDYVIVSPMSSNSKRLPYLLWCASPHERPVKIGDNGPISIYLCVRKDGR